MNIFTDSEDKLTCVYDKSHRIAESKMQAHLALCRKNHTGHDLGICDFNRTHRVPKPELRYHNDHCVDRAIIERKILRVENQNYNAFNIQQTSFDDGESWDNENFSTYDATLNSKQSNVIRQLDVESASKRRNFRLNERQRISKLLDASTSKQKAKAAEGSIWANSNKEKENEQKKSSKEKATTIQALSEEAAHLSLNDRIKKGNKKTYEPNVS